MKNASQTGDTGLHDNQELRTELTASGAAQKKLVVEAARRQRNVQATALDAAKAEAHQELQALRSKLAASDLAMIPLVALRVGAATWDRHCSNDNT